MKKKAVVIHSGGMDSSICLKLAIDEWGKDEVISLSFSYKQRHSNELIQATKICQDWKVDHKILSLDFLQGITHNALMDEGAKIVHPKNQAPNTLVVGRNGLMARLGAIFAKNIEASLIYMGVIEVDGSQSGYRDCSRIYMDLKQKILRIDLDDPNLQIRTPLVQMSKKETMILANRLGVLEYLLKETITCYHGKPLKGCEKCPSCLLRNKGIREFVKEYPEVSLPFNP